METKLTRGQKRCKKCNTINGVRSFNCKSCQNSFEMKKSRKKENPIKVKAKSIPVEIKPIEPPKVKVARFKKARFKKIKIKRPQKTPIIDHQLLNGGDLIKVLKGTGPFYIDSQDQKMYFTAGGKYVVDSVLKEGILAKGKLGGMEFLYMGKTKKSPLMPAITRSPHKIFLLQAQK